MSDQIVVDLSGRVELVFKPTDQPNSVHRQAVADAANALLLALRGGPECAGVVMLARALGCEIKRGW